MLCLQQEVLNRSLDNADDSEVIIDLRRFGLGLVVIAPIDVRHTDEGRHKVRVGYTADKRVPIYRRKVFREVA